MPYAKSRSKPLTADDSGVTALEYALIAAIVAVVVIGALTGVGEKLRENFDILVAAIAGPEAPGEDFLGPGGPPAPAPDGGSGEDADSPGPGDGEDGGYASGAAPGPGMAGGAPQAGAGSGPGGGVPGADGAGGSASGFHGGTGVPGWGSGGEQPGGGPRSGGAATASAAGDVAEAGSGEASDPRALLEAADGAAPVFATGTADGRIGVVASPAEAESEARYAGPGAGPGAAGALVLSLWALAALGVIALGWSVVRRVAKEKPSREEEDRSERAVLLYR